MFKNKKAVSPIIAAVLLVVITIAIGATTMAFIRSLADTNLEAAEESATKIACGSNVKLEVQVVQDTYKICYNEANGSIETLLHNTGTINVKGFQMVIIKNDSTPFTDASAGSSIDKNEYKSMTFVTNATIGNATNEIIQWRLEPKIQGAPGKGDTICSDVAIVRDIEDIETC